MKNKLSILAFLFAFIMLLSSCGEDNKKQDETTAQDIPENGVHYEYSDGGNSDRIVSSKVYENGKVVSSKEYDYWTDGRLKSITTKVKNKVTDTWSYNYSEEGVLSQMVCQYEEDGVQYRDDYRYNEEGKIQSLIWYEDDEYCGELKYSYNEKGNTTLEEHLDANKDVITYTEYSFDENGNTVSSHKYMYGSVSSYSLYTYNPDTGLLADITFYSSHDEITLIHKYEYNADKKVTKAFVCESDGTVIGYTESLYDEDGFNYRDIYYEDGKPSYCYDYTEEGVPVYSEY